MTRKPGRLLHIRQRLGFDRGSRSAARGHPDPARPRTSGQSAPSQPCRPSGGAGLPGLHRRTEIENRIRRSPPDADNAIPNPDRNRGRLAGNTRAAASDTVPESTYQQFGVIPARVPGTEHRAHERAGGPRPLRPPGKRHSLPDRHPAAIGAPAFPAARASGNRAGRRADTPDARPTRRRASSQHTPPARPVRAVRGKPAGYTDRPTGTKPVIYTSVDGAI